MLENLRSIEENYESYKARIFSYGVLITLDSISYSGHTTINSQTD